MTPTLVYVYGPPASGKLTVAQELAGLTGYALFHNDLSVNSISSVLPFGSEGFSEVLHRLRLDVFCRALRAGISLIFTNNSAWGDQTPASVLPPLPTKRTRWSETPGGGRSS